MSTVFIVLQCGSTEPLVVALAAPFVAVALSEALPMASPESEVLAESDGAEESD